MPLSTRLARLLVILLLLAGAPTTCLIVGRTWADDSPQALKRFPAVVVAPQEEEPQEEEKLEEGEDEDAPDEPEKDDEADESGEREDEGREEDDDETYELLRVFIDAMEQIDRNYVERVDRRELVEAAIKGMMGKLDPYSNYIAPNQLDRFKSGVENRFGGIGIQVSLQRGRLEIVAPMVGSPAYRAGLIAGDLITHIEGQSTSGITLDEAVRLMKGEIGTKVKITVLHPETTEPVEVELNREIINVETVLGDLRDDQDQWVYMYDDEAKIAYVRLISFGRQTPGELRRTIRSLVRDDGMKGLVLDLRFNPGGLLSSAIQVCDMFVSEGKIVSTDGRSGPIRSWSASRRRTYEGFPMVVLVNRYSASASEIVAACLQDHERAVVIGQRTWGKGSVQNIIELEDGKSAIKLTTAGYTRPSGDNIHREEGASDDDQWGVLPNEGFEVKMTADQIRKLVEDRRERDILKKRDPEELASRVEDAQLAKALEYLRDKLSKALAENTEEAPEEEAPEEEAPEEKAPEEKAPEEKAPEEKASDDEATEESETESPEPAEVP